MSGLYPRCGSTSRTALLIFLFINNGYLLSPALGQTCTGKNIPTSCQLGVVLEVGGCRDEFNVDICPCQDAPGPCGQNPCPNEPDSSTTTTAKRADTTETTTATTTRATTTRGDPPDQTDWGTNVTSCQELYNQGARASQVYRLYPAQDGEGFFAFCDMDAGTGTGWTVILHRDPNDPDVDFYRLYDAYIDGFGDVSKSHFLGLDRVYTMTEDYVRLMVEMTDWEGNSAFAEYSRFKVEHPALFYRLRVTFSHGSAGDALRKQDWRHFSSLDKDDDENPGFNCARVYQGAFWYDYCTKGFAVKASPTGPYRKCPGDDCHLQPGIYWTAWREEPYSLRSIIMKLA